VNALNTGAERGDHDPLDICVISERPISRAEVILSARVVGGLPMIDQNEADDKIIAVLVNDEFWQTARDIGDLPAPLIARLRHYFSTYKTLPGEPSSVVVGPAYDRHHAMDVVRAAAADYTDAFSGNP
jgi:inorganic pyrophosphatase